MWRFLFVVTLFLSSASVHLADTQAPTKRGDEAIAENAQRSPKPKKDSDKLPSRPQSINDISNCTGQTEPNVPPSITLPVYLWSVRSRMGIQIFRDGTVAANGSIVGDHNAKLEIEVIRKCIVRIRAAHGGPYLAMEKNGSLVSQPQPDRKAMFLVNVTSKDFYTFRNNNHYIAFKSNGQQKKVGWRFAKRRSTWFVLLRRTTRNRRLLPVFPFPQSTEGELSRLLPNLRRR